MVNSTSHTFSFNHWCDFSLEMSSHVSEATGVSGSLLRWRYKPQCWVTTISQCRRRAAIGSSGGHEEHKDVPLRKGDLWKRQGKKNYKEPSTIIILNKWFKKNKHPRACDNLDRNNSKITMYTNKWWRGGDKTGCTQMLDFDETVVVWIKMTPTNAYMWKLGSQLVELFGKR